MPVPVAVDSVVPVPVESVDPVTIVDLAPDTDVLYQMVLEPLTT